MLDTGARASEFLALDLADVDQNGMVTIRHGKGDKGRTVFLGQKSRRALKAFLKTRTDTYPAVWVTDDGERFKYDGLRAVMTRRAKQASVKEPSLHSFRRAFALQMLRAGTIIYALQRLMGHAGLEMLRRYLKQSTQDLQEAHQRGSPVDNLL